MQEVRKGGDRREWDYEIPGILVIAVSLFIICGGVGIVSCGIAAIIEAGK